jgi:cell division protein FtsB
METEYRLVDKTRVKTLQVMQMIVMLVVLCSLLILFQLHACMQAQLQAALIEKEEWQARAAKFEDTCEYS